MITKQADVLQAIQEANEAGFDRINTPGGTSKDCKHYAGAFVYYHDKEEKEIYFIGVPYNSNFHKTAGANGHTKKLGELPVQTAIRETQEETGLLIEEEDLKTVDSFSVPSQSGVEGEKHHKYFYLTSQFRGQLFDFQGKPNPIDNETGSPMWIPLKVFANVLFGAKGKSYFYGHRRSFERVLEALMEDKEMYFIIEKHNLIPVSSR